MDRLFDKANTYIKNTEKIKSHVRVLSIHERMREAKMIAMGTEEMRHCLTCILPCAL